jgi:RNA polymerase sigma factor (sigma-70 family)
MITTEFVRKYEGLIKAVAHDYEKDPAKFDDLTQDIWLQVCRKADLLPEDAGAHSTWLQIVAENVCKHHIRGVSQSPEIVLDSTMTPPTDDSESPPEGSWIEQAVPSCSTAEDEQLLTELLMRGATLSEQESAIFNLYYWHGRSYEFIAKKLGVSVAHVGVVCNRLRSKLEVKDLYHTAYTYHAPGAAWGDWSWKPDGLGNKRMDSNKSAIMLADEILLELWREENKNNGTNSSRQDRTSFQQAV